ncbi:MAG TPA: carbohydrate-binding protein [Tepidisphaeraceae bacterium]|nr:carbohydrate-binding protein [Tepidisphaeraceae bacterium]
MPQRFPNGKGLGVFGRRASDQHTLTSRKALKQASASKREKSLLARPPSVESLEGRQLLSASLFVAPWGSDNSAGNINAPFRTIQHAANVAHAGDHVEIRAGIYHEDVVENNSGTPGNPIVFEAYNGENVTVTGADALTGWTNVGGNVYRSPMPSSLGEGNDQLFVDGRALNEARWPNTSLDPSHPNLATIQSVRANGSSATIYDSSLNQSSNFWRGATLHIAPGQAWVAQTGAVTASGPGWVSFSYQSMGGYAVPAAGNQYYIQGKYQALDGAGEFYRDPSSGYVYASMPANDNPASHDVEAKQRYFAFDLNNAHDITIQNLNIFGATIQSGHGSSDVTVNHINARYITYFSALPDGWYAPTTDGLCLRGDYSVLENSDIGYSTGDAVVVTGAHMTVSNNNIHDFDTIGGEMAGIRVLNYYANITHNTVYNGGRSGIVASIAHASITYNTVHDVGLQTTEPGGIYTVNTNGGGAVIAYNQVYNIHTGGYGATGIFLDNNSSSWNVHDNIVWNVDYGLKMNYTCNNNNVYNNTLAAYTYSIFTNLQGNWNGTSVHNNVLPEKSYFTSGASVYSNLTHAASGYGASQFSSGASISGLAITPVTPPVTPVTPVTPVAPAPPVTPVATGVSTPPSSSGTLNALAVNRAVNTSGHNGSAGDNFGGVGYIYNNDWLEYHMNFGAGITTFSALLAGFQTGGTIELHVGSPTGALAGTLHIAPTGAWNNYRWQTIYASGLTGVQNVFLVFKGKPGVANIYSLKFGDWHA